MFGEIRNSIGVYCTLMNDVHDGLMNRSLKAREFQGQEGGVRLRHSQLQVFFLFLL